MTSLTPEQLLFVKPAIDLATNLLKPLAQHAWNWTGQAAKDIQFELCFGELNKYLQNSYQRHSYFTSMVFNNEQKKLDEYYLPLTLLKSSANEAYELSGFPQLLISQYKKLLIVDTAGMGKSTITKHLFLTCVRESAAIPILVELRKLSGTKKILDFIVESTANIEGETQRDLIVRLINSGRFLFLLDGYDEIPESERSEVASNISAFMAAAPDNWYVMTSREESSLSSFPEFQRFTIKPLERQQAYSLLRLYDKKGLTSEPLIEKLEQGESAGVHEFLSNPMLTSLLFKSFEYKKSIPIRKHIFYRQVFEALFETHDLMKEEYQRKKRSGLDIDKFEEFLRYFCFVTYQDGKFEFSKDDILAYVEKVKRLIANQTITSSNIIHDLTHGVPLLVQEGNYFRWVHRSMQEYFAALWVCRDSKEKQRGMLIKIYKDPTMKHQNLLALCADIDFVAFKKSIIKDVAKELLNEFKEIYTSLPSSISLADIQARKELVTGKIFFISTLSGLEPDEDHIRYFQKIEPLMDQCCENNGFKRDSSTWCGASGMVTGAITRPDTKIFSIAPVRALLPFIKPMNRDQFFYDIADQLSEALPIEQFFQITDDPNTIWNSAHLFTSVTQFLGVSSDWYFDQKLATDTLRQIEIEEEESLALSL